MPGIEPQVSLKARRDKQEAGSNCEKGGGEQMLLGRRDSQIEALTMPLTT